MRVVIQSMCPLVIALLMAAGCCVIVAAPAPVAVPVVGLSVAGLGIGLIVPAKYNADKPMRLDVVLHGSSKPVGLSECPHCHEPKQAHRVCANCGYYRGRQATAVDEE